MMAALTSAAMPSIVVAGVFAGTTHALDIDQAQVRDASGIVYDVYATNSDQGRKLLASRVKASHALSTIRESGGFGFSLGRVLSFAPGTDSKGPTGDTAVMVMRHQDGVETPLDELTSNQCSAMGTAIGAIHRLRPDFMQEAGYPIFVTGQIRAQLTAWIKRLRNAGHVPSEITTSWARIMDTEGLWSFSTCMVHGGFENGDVRFSGSTITAVNNWQNMQVNDPARDLAWIFSKLDEERRNAVLTAYGRMMGNRLDDLIMLRANLWVQMEQVGDFIRALNNADNDKIIQFKAQVDRLAHQLGVSVRDARPSNANTLKPSAGKHPSTITVGTLLRDDERNARSADRLMDPDDTIDPDHTGSSNIASANAALESDSTASGRVASAPLPDIPPISSATIALDRMDDETNDTQVSPDGDTVSDDTNEHHIVVHRANAGTSADAPRTEQPQRFSVPNLNVPATEVIPLLEREERALQDARTGLDASDVTNERKITPQA